MKSACLAEHPSYRLNGLLDSSLYHQTLIEHSRTLLITERLSTCSRYDHPKTNSASLDNAIDHATESC